MRKLYLAFVWHMHQPMYRDPVSHYYMMPWVRLHAVKDYLDMVEILTHYPRLKQTFNLVPSLLEQLEDYASGVATDRYLTLSQIPVAELGAEEKEEILSTFFDLNWETMIHPFARYKELADRRNQAFQRFQNYYQAVELFSDQDFLDLTTWFNLAWVDPHLRSLNPDLRKLEAKGSLFTAEERANLLEHHQRIVQAVIPAYRAMAEKGQIELTTTPYYHPIMPLLSDGENIRRSRPESPVPQARLQAPEDARWHLEKSVRYFQEHFGHKPTGLWPSEQSLSPDILPLVAEQGFKWVASSEGILWHTLKAWSRRDSQHVPDLARYLYKPYKLGDTGVSAVFRDIYLSDMIGFQCWRGDNAHNAHLFYQQIKTIQSRLDQMPDFPYLVTIALDGENCWEFYQNDGHHFLKALYTLLNQDESIESVTVSDYLERFPATDVLEDLHPGSWINSDFSTWSGDATKNFAWDLLISARQALVAAQDSLSKEAREKAWEMIYTAEGSDWFWWFGEGHSSAHDHLFDAAFRVYLQEVYKILGQTIPEQLLQPLENQVHGVHPGGKPGTPISTMQQSQEGY
jgi:alpha-amylase/alpha-mannosidase (GH57 family)